jgi:uncharacterized membrane protein YcaP (DUF421 family)
MDHLIGGADEIGWVALKAALLYLTVIVGFRLGQRRSLADMSAFDFVAAVAVGSIVGRVPNAHDASYLAGFATLVAVLSCHWVLTHLRHFPAVGRVLDQSPRLVVADGQALPAELRRCGLTLADLQGLLRRQGIADLGEVRYAILEPRGQLSIIRRHAGAEPPELVRAALSRA